ncbi:copper homeostasis protein CutC [Labrenzia sp. PHM005]|uniref:copper homeostasis protein CutC n=1 Tax=Labrenzia sp. PHM005 TaxID=2590016 RepID=UPI00113FE07F|nr:copper homeostasis protein CutC [Labrenzia sp. PHM005]QDG76146.1 copper homeostasis protein CutC [Labrenzia sp. PHM005]
MLLEVCVDTIDGAWNAIRGGAGRIELCSALSEGGLTPSAGLMAAAADLPVPVYVMIRPRTGLFHFSKEEEKIMARDIEVAKSLGLAGVVLGAQCQDGTLDRDMLERLSSKAAGMGQTLHRVIDRVPDPIADLEVAIDLGFERVLTSGSEPAAEQGLPLIQKLFEAATGRIGIMPGSGVTPENAGKILQMTGVRELHASCSVVVADGDEELSFAPLGGLKQTSEQRVKEMVEAMDQAMSASNYPL